jgi:hypothetical protein
LRGTCDITVRTGDRELTRLPAGDCAFVADRRGGWGVRDRAPLSRIAHLDDGTLVVAFAQYGSCSGDAYVLIRVAPRGGHPEVSWLTFADAEGEPPNEALSATFAPDGVRLHGDRFVVRGYDGSGSGNYVAVYGESPTAGHYVRQEWYTEKAGTYQQGLDRYARVP